MKHFRLKRVVALAIFLFVGLPVLMAQVKVSGQIVDEQGEPLMAVSILEKGTANGIITDIDGNFELSVRNNGAVLVISYVGYVTQEVKVQTDKKMNIILKEDSQALEELVVVGYGVQKKSSLTGAVSQVKSEDMEARTITRPEQALQGKTAGVQVLSASARPGASPSVRIRGVASNGDSSPLYVVDGRIASDISGIDPNDIESMEVLKDGASAAIYGAAAGNGVILITTKKGQGSGKITYDFQLTAQNLSKVPKTMNSEQYMDYFMEAGTISKETFYKYWDFETNTDWADVAFETSWMQRHNVTFQAGSDKGSLYLSMSYLDNNGMVAGDHDVYERLTGMINASWKVKPWLEIGTNNQITFYKSQSIGEGTEYGSPLLSVIQLDPLTRPTYTLDEMPAYMRAIYDGWQAGEHGEMLSDGNGNYYGISPYILANSTNPLIMRDNSLSKNRGHNINGTTYVNFTPFKGFVFTSRLGYRLAATESYGVSHDYYVSDSMKQNFVSLSGSTYHPTYYQWENFLNYSRTFGKHTASIMLGTSFSSSRSYGLSGSKSGGDGDLGVTQDIPKFWYLAYATSTATKSVSGAEPSYTKKLAYFGRLNYDYAGKYMFQFSLRADAADLSVLPTNQRWGYFPAASVGWVVSEEHFMERTRDWLDQFKIRVSWGQNGSTASLGGYSYATVISQSGSYPTGMGENIGSYINAYAPSATGNNNLKWETSEQLNIGVDFRFLRNRLTFTADYFKKDTKDLIVSGITPSTVVGNTASPVNAGNITNKGFEFELGWQDRIGDFSYGIRGNIATLKNEVTYIHESLDAIDGTGFHTYGAITRFEIGKPAWYFYGYRFAGLDQETGDPLFYDADNNVTDSPVANDKTQIGKGMADFTYGLTLTAAWKGLDLIVFGTGSQGNDIYCCLNRTDYFVNKLTALTDNRWSRYNTAEQNAQAVNPRAGANSMDRYMTSDAMVFDGSYFKIKQIQLGYSLPKGILKRIAIDNLRIYGSLEDFFTFTNYPGFDPEVTGVGSSLGVDKGSYPNAKKIVFGLSVTF